MPTHQRVQSVDRRDTRLDELVRIVASEGIDRLAVDIEPFLRNDLGTIVLRHAEPGEDASEDVRRDPQLQRASEKTHLAVLDVDSAGPLEHLHEHLVVLDLEDLPVTDGPIPQLDVDDMAEFGLVDHFDHHQRALNIRYRLILFHR